MQKGDVGGWSQRDPSRTEPGVVGWALSGRSPWWAVFRHQRVITELARAGCGGCDLSLDERKLFKSPSPERIH